MQHKCVIWPEKMEPEGHPCYIHQFERGQIYKDGELNVVTHVYDNYMICRYGHMEFSITPKRHPDGRVTLTPNGQLNEVKRRGQRVDLGGYYLDPQELPDPPLGWPGLGITFGGGDDD